MKRVVIHCGLEKTGTTFLQAIFSENRDILHKQGVLYPVAGEVDSQHYWLAKLFGFRYEFERLRSNGLESLAVELNKEIDQSDCETIFISSEHFDFNLSEHGCENLKSFFSGSDVKVVMVLRNQLDYAQSLYIEHVKWGGEKTFSEFLDTADKFDFNKRVNIWRSAGFDVEVLDYDLIRDSLLERFLHAIDNSIEVSSLVVNDLTRNVSPPIDFVEFVRHLNIGTPKESRRLRYVELKNLYDRPNSEFQKLFKKRAWGYPQGVASKVESWQLGNQDLALSLELNPSQFLGGHLMPRYFELTKLAPPNVQSFLVKHSKASILWGNFKLSAAEKFRALIRRIK